MEGITKLKLLRIDRGLTLRELSQKADLDQSTISMIENGHKKAQRLTIAKLAQALEVPFSELEEFIDTSAVERGKKGGKALWGKGDRVKSDVQHAVIKATQLADFAASNL